MRMKLQHLRSKAGASPDWSTGRRTVDCESQNHPTRLPSLDQPSLPSRPRSIMNHSHAIAIAIAMLNLAVKHHAYASNPWWGCWLRRQGPQSAGILVEELEGTGTQRVARNLWRVDDLLLSLLGVRVIKKNLQENMKNSNVGYLSLTIRSMNFSLISCYCWFNGESLIVEAANNSRQY